VKRLLVVFTDRFPYEGGEPFFETEGSLLKDEFDHILIVAGCRRGETPDRPLDPGKYTVLGDFTLSKDIASAAAAALMLPFDGKFLREAWRLIRTGRAGNRRLYDLAVMALCANHRAMIAARWIRRRREYVPETVYAYWLNIPACAALRLKRFLAVPGLPIIARCHGCDVYPERKQNRYLPLQRQLIDSVDHVAAASADAKACLEALHGKTGRISVEYLGARDMKMCNPSVDREVLRIVSCSRVHPVKRIGKIVDALSSIRDIKICWTHIGGGPGLDALKAYAGEKLGGNVQAVFTGSLPNGEVYALYGKEPFHVFVSASESEGGAPVSVCEAMSFSIPVILTDAGGHRETVDHEKNGFLVGKETPEVGIARCLRMIATMDEGDYTAMRRAARRKYESRFDAVKNGRSFIARYLRTYEEKDHG